VSGSKVQLLLFGVILLHLAANFSADKLITTGTGPWGGRPGEWRGQTEEEEHIK
jgi:hypothetical protein